MAELVPVKRVKERDGEKGEESVAFLLRMPVDLDTLGRQLAESHEWDEAPGIISEGWASRASEDDPVTIWIMNSDANTNKVKSVVDKHELPVSEWERMVRKAQAEEDFDSEEIQKILRRVVLTRR